MFSALWVNNQAKIFYSEQLDSLRTCSKMNGHQLHYIIIISYRE